MKVIVAPDSFKGTLTAAEAAAAIAAGVREAIPDADIVELPLADGGEGTVDALVSATRGRKLTRRVHGPLMEPVDATYGLLGANETAVIEMSAAAGLGLVPPDRRNPLITTTYGVGELIEAALTHNVRKIIIGVGGSATNDGGAGALWALGVRFVDSGGVELGPGGAALADLARIDASGLRFPRGAVDVVVACDVRNALIGPEGASAVYGPQKGATPEMVRILDGALSNYAKVIPKYLNKNVGDLPGGGAAGGLAAGLAAFLDARIEPGADLVLDAVGFDDRLRDADLIVTGEGRIDRQTLYGKTIAGVLRRAQAHRIPVIALAGCIGEGAEDLKSAGLAGIFALTEFASKEESIRNAADLLKRLAYQTILTF
ncbi:MAG: glycerate kinase [Armatimonadota bacterium]|nr:glycerate kinase [Armatimonadota bacterium]